MWNYRKRGKIYWAKLLQIPPNVVFHGKTFVVPYVYPTLTTSLYKACILQINIQGKTFAVLLKTTKKVKVSPSESFPVYSIGESNIWRFVLKMQLLRFLIDSFEYCMEKSHAYSLNSIINLAILT